MSDPTLVPSLGVTPRSATVRRESLRAGAARVATPSSTAPIQIETVLFDLDGTLSESEPGIVASLAEAMRHHGLTVPAPELMRTAIGPPFSTGLPAIGVPEELMDAVIERYRETYGPGGGMFDTALYDGVPELLSQLHDRGLTLAVATSKPELNAVPVLEHLGLAKYFEVISGADLLIGRLDKADVIASALERLGLSTSTSAVRRRSAAELPQSTIMMVGDRRHDVEGAGQHGIPTIAVAWGYGDRVEHEESGAWAIARTPADVVALIERFPLGSSADSAGR